MSIIKRPYEISIWKDVLKIDPNITPDDFSNIDYTSSNLSLPTDDSYQNNYYLKEERIATIGSNTMTSQNAVCEPVLHLDVKGTTTLTFSMYTKYYDNKTGQLTENPFYQYMQNEQKIKLWYDDGVNEDQWRDFIITSISPENINHKITIIATDMAVLELSKIGFNKTFNSELQNNTDTISNLAKSALEGTVWRLDENNTEEIKQYQTDVLVRLRVISGVNFTLYTNDNYNVDSTKSAVFDSVAPSYNYVYGFYSELSQSIEDLKTLHIVFLADTITLPEESFDNKYHITTREANNKDFIDNILRDNYFAEVDVSNVSNWQNSQNLHIPATIFEANAPTDVVIEFLKKGEKLIQNQLTQYDPILKRYVKKYKKNGSGEYYGYEDAEYTVEPLVQNLITNGEQQLTLDGWDVTQNNGMRRGSLELNWVTEDKIQTSGRKDLLPYSYVNFGIRENAGDITERNISLDLYTGTPAATQINTKTIRTKFSDFFFNSGFIDNSNIINYLKPGDKFRMQIDTETINQLRGFHPYIIRLPKNKSVDNLTQNINALVPTIETTHMSEYNEVNIRKSPVLIDFSYVPKEFRMFDYQRSFFAYITNDGNVTNINTELFQYAENIFIPIGISQNNTYKILFYCPYWRLYDLYYPRGNFQRLIEWHSGEPIADNILPCNAYYRLTAEGKNEVIDYFRGVSSGSLFYSIDFAITAFPSQFLEWDDTHNTLDFKNNLAAENFTYMVAFDIYNGSATPFPRNTQLIDSQASFESTMRRTYKFKEAYKYDINDGGYKMGYFSCSDLTTSDWAFNPFSNIHDGQIEIEGETNPLSYNCIDINDLDNILRIRGIWKLTHYEPSEINNITIKYRRNTFETEGIYNGIISKPEYTKGIEGIDLYNLVKGINENDENSSYANYIKLKYHYSSTILTQDKLNSQEIVILISSYGNNLIETSLVGNNFSGPSISNIILTRYYKDKDGNIITPSSIPAASTRTVYKYYNQNYGRGASIKVEKPEDIVYDSVGYMSDNNYEPQMNMDGLAYNSITTTESNIFNILQKLCEIFGCWLKVSLKHKSNGEIDYDTSTHQPKGYISFHKYIGNNLFYGFSKGLNINSIERTDVSDEIVTKMIVKQNSNEFGVDKFCTITRSIYNLLGGNEIFNFDYYINQGILEKNIYEILNTYYGAPLRKIKGQTTRLQKQLKQLAVEVAQIEANRDYYKAQYDSSIKEIDLYKQSFQTLTGKSWSYYLQHIDSMNTAWAQNGLISLYEDYIAKIQYYETIKSLSYSYWQQYESDYNTKYSEYIDKNKQITILAAHRSKIMKEFYNIYHAYIHEGSWISEDYIDDNKYYFAAEDVLNTSAQPKVTYNFNVVDIGALKEFNGYNFTLGDKTFVEDPEFFGYEEDGVTPYKEEVTISEMDIHFDSPEQNTITIQNYRTQFQDLFQRIAATIQAVEYHTGNYRNTKSNTL